MLEAVEVEHIKLQALVVEERAAVALVQVLTQLQL
jgi:hypothetical protein